jgi:RNA polymerase sigma factor (sigma-70 family)
MSKEENKEFYVMVNGQRIVVTEEVYRAYVRPIRAEQKRMRRNWRCRVGKANGKGYVRCTKDCSECEYARLGNVPNGNVLSLERLSEVGFDITDESMYIESDIIRKERVSEQKILVRKALERLTDRQREVIIAVFFEEISQKEIAEKWGVTHQAVARVYSQACKKLKTLLWNQLP